MKIVKMKRYFIILIALVVLCTLPVFAGTPTAENAPANSEEDAWFWLNSLSEEELIQIFGQVITSDSITYDTDYCDEIIMNKRDQERIKLYLKLYQEKYNKIYNRVSSIYYAATYILGVGLTLCGGEIASVVGYILSALGFSDCLDIVVDLISNETNIDSWNGDINDLIINTITKFIMDNY